MLWWLRISSRMECIYVAVTIPGARADKLSFRLQVITRSATHKTTDSKV